MNYFAHARPFLDQPYFMAGTGVPDWLTVVDRRVRLRAKHAEALRQDARPWVAQVAGGVLQHLRDDARFHETRAFAETSLALTVRARDALPAETGLRPAFLGHLLTELLLDAALIAENPAQLAAYYRVLESVDPARVEAAVNGMAAEKVPGTVCRNGPPGASHKRCLAPFPRLALLIGHFCRERILWNYLEDDKLMVRLNQVMRRVKLAPLPDGFAAILPAARILVESRKMELLEGIPLQTDN